MNATRWIALHCGDEAETLLANYPKSFLLLTQIAMRAQWKDNPITGIKAGEAFIGDYQNAGLGTQMEYRHAKKVLVRTKLATFRGTNKGTVASLVNTSIFSISAPEGTSKGTNEERTRNEQGTTTHTDTQETRTQKMATPLGKSQKVKKDKITMNLPFPSEAFSQAWQMWEQHRKEKKKPLTPTSVTKQFEELLAMGEKRAIAAINHSITRGWQGIFEPTSPTSKPPAIVDTSTRSKGIEEYL